MREKKVRNMFSLHPALDQNNVKLKQY